MREQRVRELIAEYCELPAEDITNDKHLQDDLLINSLERVELAMSFEDDFGIEIPDDDIDGLKTVQDCLDYVGKRVPA